MNGFSITAVARVIMPFGVNALNPVVPTSRISIVGTISNKIGVAGARSNQVGITAAPSNQIGISGGG